MYKNKFVLDPWSSLDKIFNNFNHSLSTREGDQYPKVHTIKGEDELILSFELPGVDPEKVELTYKEDSLNLKAERKILVEEWQKILRSERPQGRFERSFILPFKVDEDKVQAQYKDGILTVKLQKEAAQASKKITIQTQGVA